jgi:hypothetical protein
VENFFVVFTRAETDTDLQWTKNTQAFLSRRTLIKAAHARKKPRSENPYGIRINLVSGRTNTDV